MKIEVTSDTEMKQLGGRIAGLLHGGEVIELIGDVGAGKTTLTKGIGRGLGVAEAIQSPSFTISRSYDVDGDLRLVHYDFYRLQDAGIMSHELAETVNDPNTITVIEWADAVQNVLPSERLQVRLVALSEMSREVDIVPLGTRYKQLIETLA